MRVHLTNLNGVGARLIALSLLQALSQNKITRINEIYLPHNSYYINNKIINKFSKVSFYKRFLKGAVSRFFETTILSYKFNGLDSILVLGDIPLRVNCSQTLFVQQSHLFKANKFNFSFFYFKLAIAKLVFRLNVSKVNAFIVQSNFMKDNLEAVYPQTRGKVYVVKLGPPVWLLKSLTKKRKKKLKLNYNKNNLRLIYPSSAHDYKNYKLLSKIIRSENYPISEMIITIEERLNPAKHISWLKCVGFINSKELIKKYLTSDALIFLSKEESYGIPLVEAMFFGLPIICPDLPYARSMCGKQAIYFNPDSEESLLLAIKKLKNFLDKGWSPSWKYQMKNFEKNWDEVAKKMTAITLNSNKLK